MGKTWMGKASLVLGLITVLLPVESWLIGRSLMSEPLLQGSVLWTVLRRADTLGWLVARPATVALGIWTVSQRDRIAGWIGIAIGGIPLLGAAVVIALLLVVGVPD